MTKSIYITIAIFTVLGLSLSVHAETEIIQVTSNNHIDILPAINDNYLIWQGYHNGDWEVYLYNISLAQTKQITDNAYHDISAQIDGNYVTWLSMNNAGGNIFLYDINSGQITQVTDNEAIKSPPQIADGLVAWTTQEVTESVLPGDVKLYKIVTGTTTTLSASVDPEGNLDDYSPLIRDNKVIWVQAGLDNIETTIFIYDLTTGTTVPVPDDFTIDPGSTRDGNLTITTKFIGLDREIFLNHQRLKRNEQITNNSVEEKHPRIDGNHLAWVGGEEKEQEIYLGLTRYLAVISPGDGLFSYEKEYPVFMWESIGYNRFRVQVSTVREFKEKQTRTFPQLGDSWLHETSFTADNGEANLLNRLGERNQPLYWRVLAQDEYGNETISKVHSFVVKNRRVQGWSWSWVSWLWNKNCKKAPSSCPTNSVKNTGKDAKSTRSHNPR